MINFAFLKMILLTTAVPALLNGIILLLFWRPWREEVSTQSARSAGALGVACGYVLGHWAINGFPTFPPQEATSWMLYLLVPIAVLSLVENRIQLHNVLKCALVLAFAGCCAWFLLPEWHEEQVMLWRAGIFTAIFVLWLSGDALAMRAPGVSLPLVIAAQSIGVSGILVLANNAKFGQMAGVVGASVGATVIVALKYSAISVARGTMLLTTMLFTGLLVNGYLASYSDVPLYCYALVLFAPLLAWAGNLKGFAALKARQVVLIRLICTILPIVIALAMAYFSGAAEADYGGSSDYPY